MRRSGVGAAVSSAARLLINASSVRRVAAMSAVPTPQRDIVDLLRKRHELRLQGATLRREKDLHLLAALRIAPSRA